MESSILGSLRSFNFVLGSTKLAHWIKRKRKCRLVRHPQLINMKQNKYPHQGMGCPMRMGQKVWLAGVGLGRHVWMNGSRCKSNNSVSEAAVKCASNLVWPRRFLIWLAHHFKKKTLWSSILKYRGPSLWPSYIGERRTIFAKAHGIEVRCYLVLFTEHVIPPPFKGDSFAPWHDFSLVGWKLYS